MWFTERSNIVIEIHALGLLVVLSSNPVRDLPTCRFLSVFSSSPSFSPSQHTIRYQAHIQQYKY